MFLFIKLFPGVIIIHPSQDIFLKIKTDSINFQNLCVLVEYSNYTTK